jgi:hypothetical protein
MVRGVARQVWRSSGGRGNYGRRMAYRYEYTVVELREGMNRLPGVRWASPTALAEESDRSACRPAKPSA